MGAWPRPVPVTMLIMPDHSSPPERTYVMRRKITAAAFSLATTAVLWLPTLAEAGNRHP
jgi:hypothetical protein